MRIPFLIIITDSSNQKVILLSFFELKLNASKTSALGDLANYSLENMFFKLSFRDFINSIVISFYKELNVI